MRFSNIQNTSIVEDYYNAVKSLVTLDQLYKDGDVKKKRQIIGSIFPEKLVFDGSHYRTARLNEAV